MKKQKYYSNKDILRAGCEYMLQMGERSNGKSYADKYYLLYRAYHEKDLYTGEFVPGYEFAYIRRWDLELKSKDVEQYFSDMVMNDNGDMPIKEITGGEYSCVSVYQRRIYFANIDEEGKVHRGKLIGHCFAITQETHYKSLAFPLCDAAIFEEFITKSGYLEEEPERLMQLLSTIFRRRSGKVFLVGNTISRACPYFAAWGLSGVLRQDQGTIAIYKQPTDQQNEDGSPIYVNIAVEYCENSGNNSKMFFGHSAKMITSGTWEADVQPKLAHPHDKYKLLNDMIFNLDGLGYRAQLLKDPDGLPLVYVYPLTKTEDKKRKRTISDVYSLDRYTSKSFLPNKYRFDTIYMELLRQGKYAFSDNLTGTEFLLSIKNHGLI